MTRRLYFLFPSKPEAIAAINDIVAHDGVSRTSMHVLVHADVDVRDLPLVTPEQRRDLRARLARSLWKADLGLFAVALVGLIIFLLIGSSLLTILAVAVLAVTFIGGAVYAIRVPEMSLEEFRGALAHGELLLMVDVPRDKVLSIEQRITRRHPAAIAGGSSWTVDGLAI